MSNDITDYNNIANTINIIKEKIEEKQKFAHEDDDDTNKILEEIIDNLNSVVNCIERLHFYDSEGNRLS